MRSHRRKRLCTRQKPKSHQCFYEYTPFTHQRLKHPNIDSEPHARRCSVPQAHRGCRLLQIAKLGTMYTYMRIPDQASGTCQTWGLTSEAVYSSKMMRQHHLELFVYQFIHDLVTRQHMRRACSHDTRSCARLVPEPPPPDALQMPQLLQALWLANENPDKRHTFWPGPLPRLTFRDHTYTLRHATRPRMENQGSSFLRVRPLPRLDSADGALWKQEPAQSDLFMRVTTATVD